MYTLPDIRDADVTHKKVFLLADLDVPLDQHLEVLDDSRLKAAMPTIEYLLKKEATIILGGKLGRPEGKVDQKLSLYPVAKWFGNNSDETKIGEFDGWQISKNFFVLENLRFYPEEEENGLEFSKKLASLASIYVNDAFAMCHRSQASTVGLPSLLPHYAGIHLLEEIEVLGKVLKDPKRPFVVIIGGAKIETKLPLITHMCKIADYVLVGGKIAQEAQHISIDKNSCTLIIAKSNEEKSDITAESINQFLTIIHTAATIVWNGPVGITNEKFSMPGSYIPETEKGTRLLAEGVAKASAYKVVGGGDTVEFIQKIGLTDKFDFVSTGGGAMLSFLSGEKLPGLEALCI